MEWRNVDYNLGNFFDGTYFTVPVSGLYSFYLCSRHASSNAGWVYLFLNGELHIWASRSSTGSNTGLVSIDPTLKLEKNDKIDARFHGTLSDTQNAMTTYFQGRLIARLDG